MTSTGVRWVFVESATGEGVPVDRGKLDFDAVAGFDPNGLLTVLLGDGAEFVDRRVQAIGLTWHREAEDAASALLEALTLRGVGRTVVVAQVEAAEALARGIADVAGYRDVCVCIVEPDTAIVAMVNAQEVTVDRFDRSTDGVETIDVPSYVMAMLDVNGRRPDAIVVLGSGELGPTVSALADIAAAPVISAAESDLAMARGAALASARTIHGHPAAAKPRSRLASPVGALTSVLVAAVVTFVVSLSAAVGLRLTPAEQPQIASAEQPARVASAPAAPQLAPQARPAVPPPPAAPPPPPVAPPPPPPPAAPPAPVAAAPVGLPPVAQTIVPAAPPPAAIPMAPPPPAYVPPAYVPPPPPQPRLRDRIIERIPIINRFHEPQ